MKWEWRLWFRLFKKPVQRGRSERRGEAYFEPYVEALSDARTKPGVGRVSARWGWVGETAGFFNSLSADEVWVHPIERLDGERLDLVVDDRAPCLTKA